MLLTTLRRDNTPVKTPVWVVALDDGKLGFWTSSGSGKAKRLAHNDQVTVQPCNARGQVKHGASPTRATAQLVTGPAFETIRDKVRKKYGSMTTMTKFLGTVGGILKGKRIPYGDIGVVVTPMS